MQPFQERVVKEKEELDTKLSKLSEFCQTFMYYSLNKTEQSLLNRQFCAMTSYSTILGERIASFK